MTARSIPLPTPTPVSAPFWKGCQRGELLVQRCGACGEHVFIPMPCCTHCTSLDLEWVRSSGQGTVYSYSVVWRPQQPAFATPYIVAIVEMEEGWKMLSNLLDCTPEAVAVGMPVEVVFREMSDETTLPYFRPRQ
jgi:uncharacterized OB-fold protein